MTYHLVIEIFRFLKKCKNEMIYNEATSSIHTDKTDAIPKNGEYISEN